MLAVEAILEERLHSLCLQLGVSGEDVKEIAHNCGGVLFELLENLGSLVDEENHALSDNEIVSCGRVTDKVINQAGEERDCVLMQVVFFNSIKQ